MSRSSLDGWFTPPEGSVAIRQCPFTRCRVNPWFSCARPRSTGLYWPLVLTLPSSCAVISTTAVSCDPNSRRAVLTVGGWAITVTAGPGPGCQDRLAALVRYSRAIAWWSPKSALASRKFWTICDGLQAEAGGPMISPQQSVPC